MNGQERPHSLAPSTIPSTENGAPASSASSRNNSWVRDMVTNPLQSAQFALQNSRRDNLNSSVPHFDPSSSAHPRQPFPTIPLNFQHLYNGSMSSLGAMMPPMQLSTGDEANNATLSTNSTRLLVPVMATTSSSNLAGQPVTHQTRTQILDHSAETDTPVKRLKPATAVDASSNSASVSQHHTANSTPIPHRPEYFHQGSVIQLSENRLKRIEDLQTSDFEMSARLSPNLSLDCSTVTKISEDPMRGTAFLTFSVGNLKHNPVDATVEATLEHPFFVFDQGWSSVSPERTLIYYKMKCHKLKVYDRCISITFKDRLPSSTAGLSQANSNHTAATTSS